MTKISIVLAVLISFVISAAAGPVIIPILRKLKVGQTVRDDGPQTHLKKNGTPTMGGIIFLLAVLAVALMNRTRKDEEGQMAGREEGR